MDVDLPGYAWDLLPYKSQPLDLYRAHFWHAEFNHDLRTPFAAIYTSLGCKFKCDFCMINIVNRTDNADGVGFGELAQHAVLVAAVHAQGIRKARRAWVRKPSASRTRCSS